MLPKDILLLITDYQLDDDAFQLLKFIDKKYHKYYKYKSYVRFSEIHNYNCEYIIKNLFYDCNQIFSNESSNKRQNYSFIFYIFIIIWSF